MRTRTVKASTVESVAVTGPLFRTPDTPAPSRQLQKPPEPAPTPKRSTVDLRKPQAEFSASVRVRFYCQTSATERAALRSQLEGVPESSREYLAHEGVRVDVVEHVCQHPDARAPKHQGPHMGATIGRLIVLAREGILGFPMEPSIVVHELGHALDNSFEHTGGLLSDSHRFRAIQQRAAGWRIPEEVCGERDDPREFFAQSFSHYCRKTPGMPERLRTYFNELENDFGRMRGL